MDGVWRKRLVLGAAIAAITAGIPAAARGGHSTIVECIEGADFIANAAASRDNGMSRKAFLERLDGDFVAIRAYPVALRWFVKDADDERFLRAAVVDVYDRPQGPDRHRERFFTACVSRAAA